MEDDWASPWADAHDRSPTEVIKKLDARDDAAKSGDEPERQVLGGNIAVHGNDPWGGGEHGFGDASAWASPSPVRSGRTPAVGGESGLPRWDEPVGVEVPSFVVKKAADEKRRSSNAIRDTIQETGTGESGEWLGDGGDDGGIQKLSLNIPTAATDEVDVWATGPDWSIKSEKAEEPPLDKGVTLETAPENIPPPEFDTLIKGVNETVPIQESNREDQSIDTTVSDHEHEIRANANEESVEYKVTSIEDVLPLFGLGIDVGQETRQGAESENRAETTHEEVKNSGPKEELKGVGDSDDDFGDFADEEDFEDAQENLPEKTTVSISELPPLPPTPRLRPDITFDIQTSLVNKLYPIFTTYPEPPPIEEELIYSTESRRAWYRLSQSSTIRKDKSGDDDYVRVTWHGSKIQEDVGKIVARWMTEDRNSGSGVALGGSRRLGAMFGWGEGIEQKTTPTPLNLLKGNTSGRSSIESLGLGGQGVEKSPSGISTTMTSPVESGVVASLPQTTSFGWSGFGNTQPTVESSHPGSNLTHLRTLSRSLAVVGEDKLPSSSSRASPYDTRNLSGIPSQPVTPGGSTKSDSPISRSHSRQPSHTHSLAPTQPSSPQAIRTSTEVVETTIIPEARTDSPFPSTSAVSNPVDHTSEKTSAPAPDTGFDEWHTFENMTTTVKLPSAKDANCNFDEWGSFDDLTKAEDPKIADSGAAGSVGAQDRISGLPIKNSGTEEGSKDDEWSTVEEPETASKTTSLDKSSARSSLQILAKLEDKRELDTVSALAAFKDPPIINSLPSEQPLTNTHPKPTESSGSSAPKTDDWGFGAFEGTMASSPAISVPIPMDTPKGLVAKSIEAPDSQIQTTDNWGSLEAFESTLVPQLSTSNQSSRILSIQPPKKSNINLASKPGSEDSKEGLWGSFGTPEKSRSKTTGNINLPALPVLSGSTIKPPALSVFPASPALAVVEDDDDDWGEMVQSPQVPDVGSCFSSALRPTSSTPLAMSPALSQLTQPTLSPQPLPITPVYDFSSFETTTPVPERNSKPKNGGGMNTWDLSFFDGQAAANKAPVDVATPSQGGNDLWDAPAPALMGRRMNAREAEEDGIVRGILDGLPDLSYMLQQM